MSLDLDDTIVAIASAPGPAARGILRVSGPQSAPLVLSLFHPDGGGGVEPPRRPQAFTGNLRIASENVELPARLYLWPTQRSYTGQPAAELHTIGCPPLLEAALSELTRCGARVARPGEFTLRAFLAGRL